MVSFPFFFNAENLALIFFFWLISMCFSYRILALIYNAGPWLFLLKVWSLQSFPYKSLFSVADCFLQVSPLGAGGFGWVGGAHPRTSVTIHPQLPVIWEPSNPTVFLLIALRQEAGAIVGCRVSDPWDNASPSSGRFCLLCHRSAH